MNEVKSEKRVIGIDEARQPELNSKMIGRELAQIILDLRYLASEIALDHISVKDGPDIKQYISEEFLNFLRRERRYDQIRFIDNQGMEVIRINSKQGELKNVGTRQLQSRAGQDYFKETLHLSPGQVYLSSFDLSKEKGRVESPFKPVIRAGTPLFDKKGEKYGVLILNYLGNILIEKLHLMDFDKSEKHMLLTADGFWIESANPEDEWGFILPDRKNRTMGKTFPEAWGKIKNEESGHFDSERGRFSFTTINPIVAAETAIRDRIKGGRVVKVFSGEKSDLWKVVSFTSMETLREEPMKRLKKLLLFCLFFAVITGFSALILAITIVKRETTDKALQEHHERTHNIINAASDGIITIYGKGTIESINPAALSIFGYETGELIGKKINILMPEDDRSRHDGHVKHALDKGLQTNGSMGGGRELKGLRKDGTSFPIEITLSRSQRDQGYRFTGIIRDISMRQAMEETIRHNAFYDSLTQLPNRMLLLDRLRRCIKQAKRSEGYKFAVLFLDLDRFKTVNDSLGHLVGDQLLVELSKRLMNCIRSCDTIARLGGDEMAMLVEGIVDVSDVTVISERILNILKNPFHIEGNKIFSNLSIGIALSSTGYETPEDILRDADIAMYRAKTGGRARYEIFDTTMRLQILEQQKLEQDLRQAIDLEEFELHYQPIVSLETGQLASFEALIRWRHPKRGLVSPSAFIPLAEETRLIIPIGHFVLYEACRQLADWHARYPSKRHIGMSMNLSSKQLLHPKLVQDILQILKETKCNPNALKFEITETLLMENVESIHEVLLQLKQMNIQFYIDDFGTGYSSLSYLHQFPFDALKIDCSFTSKICDDKSILKIIKTIISLAEQLGMDVITEGIETGQQLAQIKELNCKYGQGYYFSRPVEAETASALIAKGIGEKHAIQTV